MFASDLDEARRHLSAATAALDVERLAPADAAALVPTVVAVRNQAVAALALLAARAADGAPSDREATRWLATQAGDTYREARATLDTGIAVRPTTATRSAFQAGQLSAGTARAIAAAAGETPHVEDELLDHVRGGASAEDVRRRAARERQKARNESEDERQHRLHRNRRFTTWEGDDGATHGHLATTPLQWAPVAACLEAYQEAAFRRARRTGEHAPRSAHAVDGFALMAHVAAGGDPADLGYLDEDLPAALRRLVRSADGATTADDAGNGEGPSPEGARPESTPARRPARRSRRPGGVDRKVIVRVDAAALRRGHAEPGEVCDIAGVGPVPVTAVRDLLPEAFAAVVVTDGHDVASVAHLGRRPTAFQRTALEWRLDECCTVGCHNRARRDVDHDDPWVDTHHTWLPGLNQACTACHARKTHQGWAFVGDADAYGKRRLVPPDDPDHPVTTGERPARPPRVAPPRSPAPPADGREPPDELPLSA